MAYYVLGMDFVSCFCRPVQTKVYISSIFWKITLKMKPEGDFSQMFMIVDVSNKGYLTLKEVADFYQSLFFQKVKLDLVSKTGFNNFFVLI